jgi:site-specific recombinase XerD
MNTFIELFRKELLEIACLKDDTVATYLKALYAYADYAKSTLHIKLVDSKARHLHKWLYCLKANNKSYNFIKDSKVVLNKFFAFLVKTGHRKSNPVDKLPRVKVPKGTLNKPLATQVLVKLLNSFDKTTWMGMRNFTIVAMLWALGLRVSELRAIKRQDIDLDYDPGNKTGTILVHGKGGKERTLFIVDDLFDTLFHYLRLKKTPKARKSFIFPCTQGPIISRNRVRQMIIETAAKAGITGRFTPHVFRHTFATDMYNRDVPVEAVKDIMGHESIRETSVYVHITDELQAMALNKLSLKERVK